MSENDIPMLRVTALRIIDAPPDRNGHRIIGEFDFQFAGFEVSGCALVRTAKNGLAVWPPRIGDRRAGRGCRFTSSELANQAMAAARAIYQAMGGMLAKWTPSENSVMRAIDTIEIGHECCTAAASDGVADDSGAVDGD